MELVASLTIIMATYNEKYSCQGLTSAVALLIFTIMATLLYYFPVTSKNYYKFVDHMVLIGALLMFVHYFCKKCYIEYK